MKISNRRTELLATTAILGVLAIVFAVWAARPVHAIIIIGTKTGLFGVTTDQTVRVSILNSALTKGGIIPCAGIFDINGNRLARFEGTMPLRVGHGTYFDFDATSLDLRAGERAQLRVEVELEPSLDDGRSNHMKPDDIVVTVEVFDNVSGKTMFVVPATLKGFNPQPEPPAPQQ
ncbi:MAG TPA: hypothetical protein VL866_13335 [Pyrinomonadaceae bacterium]|nr:hypothetical protein [Pyrinomonadaceae bacterium]